MEGPQSGSQERWDDIGKVQLQSLAEDPNHYVIRASPYANRLWHADLMLRLGAIPGKEILDIGCGRGEFSVFLSKEGARVSGIDIGENLIAASQQLARMNGAPCTFQQANCAALPFQSKTFDIAVGIGVLHHLSEKDLRRTLHEVHRVLKTPGAAFFYESIENSRAFDFVQNLFPAGKPGEPDYRPSMLNRPAWKRYEEGCDQRSLTNRELISAGAIFSQIEIKEYGLLIRLKRLVGARHDMTLHLVDSVLLKAFPALRRFCRGALVEYRKGGTAMARMR